MPKKVIVDSGYWMALYKPDDGYHNNAVIINEYLPLHNIIIPWPSLYEYLNTKFFKQPDAIRLFKKTIILPNIEKLPDCKYRETALSNFFDSFNLGRRLSLVDLVIREMILDESIKIDNLVTFNGKDFDDACAKRGIEMFSG